MKIQYSHHALERMNLRHVSKQDVVDALVNGAFHYESPKTYKVHNGAFVVVVKETKRDKFKIITVHHGKKTNKVIKHKQKVFNFGYKKACKIALSV